MKLTAAFIARGSAPLAFCAGSPVPPEDDFLRQLACSAPNRPGLRVLHQRPIGSIPPPALVFRRFNELI